MELEYPTIKDGFSFYTIFDTPSPNLANATAHKEATKRGVDATDVIVFTIDYSKYLTDDEYQYLKEVWKMCQEKGKKYSLILNVNKLDLRYDDSSDKSVVRIVDFIRNKLIATGKQDGIDFRNCVVIGTSALTYFNALTAPALKCPYGRRRLQLSAPDRFLRQNNENCISSYDEGEEISVEYGKKEQFLPFSNCVVCLIMPKYGINRILYPCKKWKNSAVCLICFPMLTISPARKQEVKKLII